MQTVEVSGDNPVTILDKLWEGAYGQNISSFAGQREPGCLRPAVLGHQRLARRTTRPPLTYPGTWHVHAAGLALFNHVRRVPAGDVRARQDGHTTAQKYLRIRTHTAVLAPVRRRRQHRTYRATARVTGRPGAAGARRPNSGCQGTAEARGRLPVSGARGT
ncbi:hypothetical protein ACFY0A_39440 [Streptomyces sp. NPDC001698]|uniref:hypothetical protein n=1 Tax=unclassified Streptomyces TaxID=2593676 RepID=UPI0036D08AC0